MSKDFSHLRAGQGFLVKIDEGFLVAFWPHDAEHQVFKDRAVLPRLTTVGQRDKARGLEFVACRVEFIKGGWRLVDACLFEHFGVDPQPVNPVNVHRYSHVMTVIFHGIGHGF